MIYLVSYDLFPKRNASGLMEELRAFPLWWHHLDSTWLISAVEDANGVFERLRHHLLTTDRILIIELLAGAGHQGWLTKEAWDWVQEAPYRQVDR